MTEIEKEDIKLLVEGVTGLAASTLIHTAVTYAVGKRVAPSVFTGFGRTYAILWLIRLLRVAPKLPDSYKARVEALQERKKTESETK